MGERGKVYLRLNKSICTQQKENKVSSSMHVVFACFGAVFVSFLSFFFFFCWCRFVAVCCPGSLPFIIPFVAKGRETMCANCKTPPFCLEAPTPLFQPSANCSPDK
eukprot:TRINITY_DN3582_c2_g1_i1.p1 TRINITY_DN3582_c2_g1~~TRINITY_DN3582_c2_g1_i1.p1  ORF type:complete len:106 (+),score=5.45 TRINITY_DN3582_c2_g1_i1:445-762(+)